MNTSPIPEIANEIEAPAFWESNDSTDYMDWANAKRAVFRTGSQRPKPSPRACHSISWTPSKQRRNPDQL